MYVVTFVTVFIFDPQVSVVMTSVILTDIISFDFRFMQVHHEMAKYHEVGRFIINGERSEDNVDWESAVFHEEHAADLGELEAIVTMAKLHLALERDVLVNCTIQVCHKSIFKF